MPLVDIACIQTIGARETQEDCAAIWPGDATFEPEIDWPEPTDEETLVVLADGMGGHAAGDLASRLVCETFVSAFADRAAAPPTDRAVGSAGRGKTRVQPRRTRLKEALSRANAAVGHAARSDPARSGMGSTLVAAVFSGDGLEWLSVGDSPLLLFRQGELALLNEDHSLAPALDQLVAEGKLSPERARADPRRHMLRSAVTGERIELIDLCQKPLELVAGDIILCASDGIDTLEHDEIARIVSGYSEDGAREIAQALLREVANYRVPMQDNTTVVVAKA